MQKVDVPAMPAPQDDADGTVMAGRRSSKEQIVAQQAATAQIGQRALEERSLETLLRETCEHLARVLDAELTSIAELSEDAASLRIVAGTGWRPGIVGDLVLGTGAESMAGLTLSSGQPVVAEDFSTEERFRVAESLRAHGASSGISVRIGGAADPYGTLAVFTRRPVGFTREDVDFVQAIANVLAAAIGRLRIERELRASSDQLAAIVGSIDEGITVQSRTGLLYANDEAAKITGFDSATELINATDVISRFDVFDETGQPMPTNELPSRRAMNGEQPPETLVGFHLKSTGEMRWSLVRAIPLQEASGEVGSVINIFREVTTERWQQQARDHMAEAIAALSSTLDVAEAAQRLANLSVPRLADYCTVTLRQPDGSIQTVAIAHVNPERVDTARWLRDRLPIDPDAPTGAPKVIREGGIEQGDITPELIDAAPLPDDVKTAVHRLEMKAFVTVPLTGRRGPIGALSLVMAESGRSLGQREIDLAKELGARAGIALENATLYQSAEARRAELDAVLAALAEAVLVFDASGSLRLRNQAADRMFKGRTPATVDELLGRVTADRSSVTGEEVDLSEVADGEPVEVELDGHGQWLELRRYRAPAADAESGAPVVMVLRDINEVRAARAARDAFMGVLSHELRTPITTIYGGSELLERGLDEERRTEVIADIRAESERLARLVEDLLVMTRVERGIVDIADEPILLQHLLASVINSFGARWPQTRIDLRAADRLPAVRGDATYIEQVVRNLLTNAMRYGRGAESGIDVTAERQDEFVVVRVLDSGLGFGGEDPERLFELFYRTSSARSVPGGAGIGLFVCRNLIEKMDGRIWAEERPEGGAEFGFSLPVLETEAGV